MTTYLRPFHEYFCLVIKIDKSFIHNIEKYITPISKTIISN